MNAKTASITGIAMVVLALAAGGCAQKEKLRIVELEDLYNEQSSQNAELRAQVAEGKALEAALTEQLQLTESDLASARASLSSAKSTVVARSSARRAGAMSEATLHKITIGSDVLFNAGRATLTTGGKRALNDVIAKLKTSYPGYDVRVLGHTDNDPIVKTRKLWADNLDLSANRAMTVTRYFIEKGIPAKRIETVAMGEHHPVADNRKKAGKASNRRVEVLVVQHD